MQTASQLTAVILDKTGTITEGHPAVTAILPNANFTEEKLLQTAASIERNSEHPLAEAIIASANKKNIQLLPTENFEAISGHGVKAKINGENVLLGNDKLMASSRVAINALQNKFNELANLGQTPMFLAINNQLAGIISVSDPIKTDAKEAIAKLQKLGIKVIMLTGDNKATAEAVAKQVNINEVFAEVLPDQKSSKVELLQKQGNIVGMVGDGINDAPALARANVGFAIGTGTDVAIESADVALMSGSLHGVFNAINVSKKTLLNIKENLVGAFAYNTLGIPIAAGILYPFFGTLLSPIIAGAAMAASSLTVVLNANRLRRLKVQR